MSIVTSLLPPRYESTAHCPILSSLRSTFVVACTEMDLTPQIPGRRLKKFLSVVQCGPVRATTDMVYSRCADGPFFVSIALYSILLSLLEHLYEGAIRFPGHWTYNNFIRSPFTSCCIAFSSYFRRHDLWFDADYS